MVLIIGHRGAMAFELENSMSSFKKALELKADMIELMAEAADISKAAAERAYNAFVQGVVDGVKGGPVNLVGFGTFKISHRKARKGVNPRTGEQIDIAASNAITFKAGKKTKEEINE